MSKNMTAKEKLIFLFSFVWCLHWGTCIFSKLVDTVILNQSVKMLPTGF